MPRTRTAATPATEPKTHRIARTAVRKTSRVRSAPAAMPEFNAAAHHQEIALAAYYNWLERSETPEEDWLKAEIEVRARYTR
jgi:hypothetical protein